MPTIKFRQDTVRTLPYVGRGGKHQCIYWDANLEGFGVRVYPTGGRTYVCTYRVNRRKRLAKLGRVDVLTLDQATKKAKAYLGKVANNDDPLEQSDAIKKAPTVEELVKADIEGHAKPQKQTWKQDESSLRRNISSPTSGSMTRRTKRVSTPARMHQIRVLYTRLLTNYAGAFHTTHSCSTRRLPRHRC